MADIPQQARVVIVGGGVIGCSVAYHLAQLGWRDVVLLERRQLTSGTTWHAAGLIGQLRATANLTQLARYSADLYTRLEAETGLSTGFRQNGSLALALSRDRMEELARGATMAAGFGLEVEVLTPADCLRLHEYINLDGVVGGVFLPTDGQGDPTNITMALAKGARNLGVRIFENTLVTAVQQRDGRVTGVVTEAGTIATEYLVNCAGMWGREFGALAGVRVPLQACEHFYVVTEAIAGLRDNLPVLRVPDECAYFKQDAGKILLGAFEPVAKPWALDGLPGDFCFDQLPADFEHIEPVLEQAIKRLPILAETGIHTFFNGPESFTPDDRYLLGEAPELRNYYVAAGFNSIGIQSAGGAGKALAEWMDAGQPPFDLWDVDIRRMQPFQSNRRYLGARVSETLGLLYADHFPYRQYASARGVRQSPLHERLAERGACFGELAGWERANWFLPQAERNAGRSPRYEYSWKRQNWFEHAAAEHRAVREGVGLFDMSSFGKLRVEGRDAAALLQYLCANDIDVEPGRIVYTQWLNQKGGIEADLTISRLSATAFLVVTPAATLQRDLAWLRRHLPAQAHCTITDMTAAEAVLCLMGPRSREVLQALTPQALDNQAFAFGSLREIEIGMALARAHRISYVGELGWEIYVASDMARHVFDVLLEQGATAGLRLCGLHALDSCRIEKAYRHFGHDISDEDHVLEAGLGFAVKTDKPESVFGEFIGRQAVLERRQQGLRRRLLQFRLHDPEPLLYHNEAIWRDGRRAGRIASANYGHWLGGAIGLGYVDLAEGEKPADLGGSSYEIEIAGERFAAQVSLQPMYDPTGARVRT